MLCGTLVRQQSISQHVNESTIENTPVIFLVFVRLVTDCDRQCILKDERRKDMCRLPFHILKSTPCIDADPWHVKVRENR